MKLKFVLSFAVLLLSQFIFAQHVNLGFKAGLNVFNINSDLGSSYDSKIGWHAGLIGHIHFTEHIALQPELMYSLKGAKYSIGTLDSKVNLAYLAVPILLQYMFDNGFRIQAGPEIGILLQAKQKTGSSSIDIKDDLKSIDFGLAAGISYVHPPSGIGIDLRYVKGLTNINDQSNETSKNQGFQLGLFYLLKHN